MQNTLGEFIRAHRERLKPADAGLPEGGRRRTPGLRREELAQLCEVSPTWLTWLEQGRQVQASAGMLARLATVLQLTAAERAYLFSVADRLDPSGAELEEGSGQGLDAIVQAITAPAYILNRAWDAVAWNAPAAALFSGWLDRRNGPHPNQLRFMFTEPSAVVLIADWQERAARLVAEFRADCGKYAYQEPLASLIASLAQASPVFAQLWQSQSVISREGGRRRFHHPEQGLLTLQQVTSHLAQRRQFKLVMLLPPG